MAGGTVVPRLPPRVRRLAPLALALVGVLLIVRGVVQPHVTLAPVPVADGEAAADEH
jgi:hypothetical protein